jgi:hypothetical protein
MTTTIGGTTLELARALADAVLAAPRRRHRDLTRDAPTQAIFRVLERAGVWFMRVEDEAGVIKPVGALEARAGVCRWCGCTDRSPCDDGTEACRWVDAGHTLCSACAGVEHLLRTARGRAELLAAYARLSPAPRTPYSRRRKAG